MNDIKQPEAMRLADMIERYNSGVHSQAIAEDYSKAAAELRRLHIVDQAFQQWIDKTEWVQKSAQSHELGMHRADVMKQRIDQLLNENKQLRADLEAVWVGGVGPLMQQSNYPEIPEGWKLVPVEPTIAMQNAGWRCQPEVDELLERLSLIDTWRAMLAVAPQPGASGIGGDK